MADFRLTAKISIVGAEIQAQALSKLKNLKINLNDKSIGQAASKSNMLSQSLQGAQSQAKILSQQVGKVGQTSTGINKATKAVQKLDKSTSQAAKRGKDMVSMFEEIGRRALAFRVAATFINIFTDSISDAGRFLRDFDQILADIAKISGQTSAELASIGSSLLKTAEDLGAVAEDVSSQFRIFVQAGFSVAQSLELARQATIGYQATTLEAAQASEILIQTMKVFGTLEADQVFDKIAAAESTAAVTATDLQEALKRSGATFQAVNATLSESIGLISALQERSRRGGAVVGTAFRTINTRIVAGKTREEVEKLGVAVADYAGNLRPLTAILSDLSLKFKTLTEEQRVEAATLIAGRRQFESFIQILASVDRAQTIAAETVDKQGEAMRRAMMQAETLNGRLNSLRTTFLEMVVGIQEFVPITDIFKGITSGVEGLIKVFDGAIGKAAALSGIFLGLKGLVPVFKGLGRVLGGFGLAGGAFPVLAGGLGLGAGGFGIGRGKPIGTVRADKTRGLASPLGGAQQKLGANTKLLMGSFLTLGVTLLGLAGEAKDTDSTLQSVSRDFAKMGGIVATSFAFGPLFGGLTAMSLAIQKVTSAIEENVSANSAYRLSMGLFGDETLAGMEAALVRAKAAGDEYTIGILEQSIAFGRAKINISRSKMIGSEVIDAVQGFITQIEEVAPGIELTMQELTEKMVAAVQQGANVDEKTARALVLDKDTIAAILRSGAIFSKEFKGLMVHSLDELLVAINQKAQEFESELTLGPVILGTEQFLSSQQKYIHALKETQLANDIVAKGIIGTAEARKMQIDQELEFAKDNVKNQRDLFLQAIGEFTQLEGLEKVDFGKIRKAFEGISGKGIEMPDMGKVVDELEKVLEEADVGKIMDEKQIKAINDGLNSLVNDSFANTELALVELRKAFGDAQEKMQDLELDELVKSLDNLRNERDREIDLNRDLQDSIRDLSITGGVEGISQAFDDLNMALSEKVKIESLMDLLGVMEDLPNPIAQARKELELNHQANLDVVKSLEETKRGIEEELVALNKQAPSEKRNAQIKKREAEITKLTANIEKARGKTIADAGRDLKKVRVEEKKAIDDLIKAQKKLVDAQKDLSTALQSLNEDLTDTINEDNADAQEKLKDAQLAVMDATEALADSYDDLKEAQLELGDAIADYKVGVGLAALEIGVITGNIRGFGAQMAALRDVFDEASNVVSYSAETYNKTHAQLQSLANAASAAGISFVLSGDQMIRATEITEEQRLKLLQESARKQLDLVQSVIDETLSIGKKFFTTNVADQAGLTRGFAALQDVANQFTAAGGFGGIDLNEFGNMLLNLPQSIRQEMVNALDYLPSTATLGGLTKEELEKVLFGAAVGESQTAGIEHIAELTDVQVELIKQIAELDQAGILAAESSLEEAKKQTVLAENQLIMDEFALQQAEQHVVDVRTEIKTASDLLSAIQQTGNEMLSTNITESNLENLTKRQQEHLARLAMLQSIDVNTAGLLKTIEGVSDALADVGAAGTMVGAYKGYVPKNYARGNIKEYMGLLRAYQREKQMGPTGSRPVVANDSELIIPTKNRGNIPNYQAGNLDKKLFDTTDLERILEAILQAVIQQTQIQSAAATSATIPATQKVEASIQVNANQRVQIDGVSSVAEAVGQSIKNALNDQVPQDQIAAIEDIITDFFKVLKDKGLVNSFGQG